MSDDLFHIVDDAHLVLRRRGVFRQCKLYRRSGKVYAGVGSGFVLLMAHGGTTQPDTLWEGTLPRPATESRLGPTTWGWQAAAE